MKRIVFFFLLVFLVCLTGFSANEGSSSREQLVLNENTKFRISTKIDLEGKTLQMPYGCTLVFRGGSISNGTIVFNSTTIKGHPRFSNCRFKGSMIIRKIDDRDFTSSDDNGTFVFLFSNAVNNGIRCNFYRDYHLSMEGVNSSGMMSFENINSGADIRFNGCSLFNSYVFPTRVKKPVIVFRNCNNITIRDCSFYDVEQHNTHLPASESNGCTFVKCYGECESINLLNCYQENGDCILRCGVYQHSQNSPLNTPVKGLSNSTLKVRSRNTGYGLALYCGDNLNIDIDVDSPRRGFYCAGVSNSKIKYHGYNPLETKCHILIKDAVYKKEVGGEYALDMRGCNNLSIKAVIDKLLPSEQVIAFATYGSGRKENADFRFRSAPCHHSHIDITADIRRYPDEGRYHIVAVHADSGAMDDADMYGCKVTDVRVHDIRGIGGRAKKYLCTVQPHTETQIEFVNCTTADPEAGYDLQIYGNAKGRIKMKNGNIENINVRDKATEEFSIDVERTRVKRGFVFYKNQSAESLVRMNQSK